MPGRILLLVAALAASLPSVAHAQDYFGDGGPDADMKFRTQRSRTRNQRLLLVGLFGGAVLTGGAGLLFHLDSRAKSNEISALPPDHTGRIYTDEVDATRRGALRSRTLAAVGYGAGAAFLIAGIIAYAVTEPGTEVVTAGKDKKPPPPPVPPVSLAPLPGGAAVVAGWSF